MAEVLSLISLISFIVAGISFVLTLFFFIQFKIPKVIGDLSGRTARKSIAKMRETNEKSGNKSYRTSSVNARRGKVTEGIPDGKSKYPDETKPIDTSRPETGLLSENINVTKLQPETEILTEYEETDMLVSDNETSLLVDEKTTMRLDGGKESKKKIGGKTLTIIDDVMLIHTNETI